jgi:hypothetical protein
MEKELADLKARLNEAQQRFDLCLDVYMEKKSECDELKKKKAYVRVFGEFDGQCLAAGLRALT